MIMKRTFKLAIALRALLTFSTGAAAQAPETATPPDEKTANDPAVKEKTGEEKAAEEAKKSWTQGRKIQMQYVRPQDKRGVNVFETSKDPGAEFNGFKLDFNAAFTSQVQWLDHENKALPN